MAFDGWRGFRRFTTGIIHRNYSFSNALESQRLGKVSRRRIYGEGIRRRIICKNNTRHDTRNPNTHCGQNDLRDTFATSHVSGQNGNGVKCSVEARRKNLGKITNTIDHGFGGVILYTLFAAVYIISWDFYLCFFSLTKRIWFVACIILYFYRQPFDLKKINGE